MTDILLLTTESPPPGMEIVKVLGMVEGHGAADWANNGLTGVQAQASANGQANIREAASEIGANAILAVRTSYTISRIGIATYTYIGTAVVLEAKKG